MTSKGQQLEVIKQGYQITNEMKSDVTEFYNASLSQEHYTHKSDYIRHHLEEKYGIYLEYVGRCFSIIIYNHGAQVSHSFLHADDYLLELKSYEHIILAYLLPPSHTAPQLLYDVQPPIARRTYSPPQQQYVSRIYDSRPIGNYMHYPPTSTHYGPRYYDSFYRSRGYGYW